MSEPLTLPEPEGRRMRKGFCCVVCGTELWESKNRRMDGPFQGEILKAGRLIPGAYRAEVLLVPSGNTADMSLCKDCKLTPENLPEVWAAILERTAVELDDDARVQLGSPRLTPEQREWADKIRRCQEMDIPIGVLSTQRLEELYG